MRHFFAGQKQNKNYATAQLEVFPVVLSLPANPSDSDCAGKFRFFALGGGGGAKKLLHEAIS